MSFNSDAFKTIVSTFNQKMLFTPYRYVIPIRFKYFKRTNKLVEDKMTAVLRNVRKKNLHIQIHKVQYIIHYTNKDVMYSHQWYIRK